MYRLDLHTHSIISQDGGIKSEQYRQLLTDSSRYIAITDHNKVELALDLQKELGDRIIVGEEIMTREGEIIGLFLSKLVPKKLSAEETIQIIKDQNGLVYIPHPLEITRRGLAMPTLERVVESIDILEVFNARTLEPWLAPKVAEFLSRHNLILAASSDAHSVSGFGTAYSEIESVPKRDNLLQLLKAARLEKGFPPFFSRFAPGVNKFKKVFIR